MFQLIVAVISIALVAVLAIAAIYYGGIAFTDGAEKSEFARYQNEGVQISSAIKVHEAMTGVGTRNFTDIPATDGAPERRDPRYNFQTLVDMELLKDDSLRTAGAGRNWIIEEGQVRRQIDMTGFGTGDEGIKRCGRFNTYAGKVSTDTTVVAASNCPPCGPSTNAVAAAHMDYPACQVPSAG